MEKEIMRMLDECRMRFHLKSLMPEKPFVIAFDNGIEQKMIRLGRFVEFALVEGETPVDLVIEADPELMADLLDGRESLSALTARREINVQGTYRGLLFADSVLTLCRKYEAASVII